MLFVKEVFNNKEMALNAMQPLLNTLLVLINFNNTPGLLSYFILVTSLKPLLVFVISLLFGVGILMGGSIKNLWMPKKLKLLKEFADW